MQPTSPIDAATLRESKEYVENLLQTANVIIVELNAAGTVVRFNDAAEQITGYSFEEIRSRDWFETLVPRDRYPDVWAEFSKLSTAGVPRNWENPILTKDGRERRIAWQNSLVQRGGEVVGTLSFGLDVTERRAAEDALRSSEEKYRVLVETTPDVIMCFDSEGRHVYVSPSVQTVVPMPPEAFLGKTHRELGFPEAQCELWESGIRTVFETGVPFETLFEVEGVRGSMVMNWRLVPVHGKAGVESVLSLARDITEQRRAERDYRTLFEQMLDGFAVHEILCDESGRPVDYRFLSVNPAFEKLMGTREGDIVGKTAREVMPNLESSWIETYGKVALSGEPIHFESRYAALERSFEVTAFSPKPRHFACIFKDITARKALEEQYLHAQKMEAVGRLAGGVAHDLNNLLTPILGYSDMLLEDLAADSVHAHSVAEVHRAGVRAKELVRQLLAFSRKQTLALSEVDLDAVVLGFEKLLRRALREDVSVVTKLSGLAPVVRGDVGQIEQVLMNLAINAQDAMPEGGQVCITTSSLSTIAAIDCVGGQVPPGRYATLMVSDSGCGMDAATLSRAFEPFFTTKALGQGTGLGLSMVYGIVEQHGGYIAVRSEAEIGTQISIYLPLAQGDVSMAERTIAPLSVVSQAGGEVVMVVEDEELVRDLAVGILSRQGYVVMCASDGRDCLRILEDYRGPLHVLLTDVVMPEMNGKELHNRVAVRFPQVKVLYMSGYSQEVISHRGVLDKGVDFIPKPFSVRGLTAKLREMLGS